MFDKNYKNAMDGINIDNETKEKILDKIILKEELKNRKNPATVWRVAFACVACVAIILGVLFVPRDSFKPSVKDDTNAPKTLKLSKSYDEIYKLIKPENTKQIQRKKKKVVVRDNGTIGFATEDVVEIIEEEIEYVDNTIYSDGAASAPGAATGNDSDKAESTKGNEDTSTNKTNDKSDDFSNTTEQVEGVLEADIVKTDGKYIYYIKGTTFSIFKADGENSALVSRTELSNEYTADYGDMLLKDDTVIILQPDSFGREKNFVSFIIYDVSDPKSPKVVTECRQEGWYNTSRMIGDYIYLISNCNIDTANIKKNDPTTFVPTTEIDGVCKAVPADSIYRYDQEKYTNKYTVVGAYNYKDGTLTDTASLLGGTNNVYCSKGNIILANTESNSSEGVEDGQTYSSNKTVVSRLEISQGNIQYKATGEVEGALENQFFIDEHNGYFRFVTTVNKIKAIKKSFENTDDDVVYVLEEFDNTSAWLTVLDSELKKVGEIGDLAKGERVYSVRFMGDIAYFVTFRQTDPLFSADLSDPANPKILGELKIPGFSEYMYPYGDGLLLGFGMDADENTGRTKDLKLSMFNITDPANVTEQDKTIVDGFTYSPALYNHKAMLVSPDKNLIGFAATGNYYYTKYMIYEYTGTGFNCKAELTVDNDYKYAMDDVRGLFIGDNFYVISRQALQVYDINTFTQIVEVKS